MEALFRGLFDTDLTVRISLENFLLCIGVSLVLGLIMALTYTVRSRYTKSFVVTLAILPCIVCVVIMMVNGNVGAGVAVAGAFSLVRFRSAAGSAKDIAVIFFAMGSGLIVGMGYLGFAAVFTLAVCAVYLLYSFLNFGTKRNMEKYKTVTVTIPEDLDYSHAFDDIFEKYTSSCEMVRVKTTNMGSMFRLSYQITLKNPEQEKAMIDELRCRNGNLEISVTKQDTGVTEL